MSEAKFKAQERALEIKNNKYAELLKEAISILGEFDSPDRDEFLKKPEVIDFWDGYHGAYWEEE